MSQQLRLTAVFQRIANEFKAVRSDMGGRKLVKLTHAEYIALETKDPNTLYFLKWEDPPV